MQERDARQNAGPARPLLVLAEDDYRFGAGTLYLAVMRVRWNAPQCDDVGVWFEVEGVEMTSDGRAIGARGALVRGSRLRSLMNNTGRYLGP